MAKGSAIVGKIWGSAGNLTFQTLKGQQVIKSKAEKVANPKTVGQVRVRSKFRYLGLAYQMMKEWLDHSFTNKERKESSMNKFFKVNYSVVPTVCAKQTNVYQDPAEIEDCPISEDRILYYFPADYQIANGSLKNVAYDTLSVEDLTDTTGLDAGLHVGYMSAGSNIAALGTVTFDNIPSFITEDNASDESVALAAFCEYLGVDVDEMVSLGWIFALYGDAETENAYQMDSFKYIRIKRTGESSAVIVNENSDITVTAPSLTYTAATDEAEASCTLSGFVVTDASGDVKSEAKMIAACTAVHSSYNSEDGWKASDAYLTSWDNFSGLMVYGDDITKSVLTEEGYTVGDEDVLDPESVTEE